MATTAQANGAAKRTRRGFDAPCIKCGAKAVQVNLADVTRFECAECGEEFVIGEVLDALGAWQAVLDWVESAPEL